MARGMQSSLILQCISLVLLLTGTSLACQEFDEIPEEQYDRTYRLISETDARPLGFKRATLVFDGPEVCFKATGVNDGRGVEVAYEAVPSSTLCVRRGDGQELGCGTKNQHCSLAVADPTEFYFYLDVGKGSSESDVNFWVRVTKGLPAANDTEDMWCQERSVSYPESLGVLPPFVTPPRPTEVSGTTQLSSTVFNAFTVIFNDTEDQQQETPGRYPDTSGTTQLSSTVFTASVVYITVAFVKNVFK